MLDQQVQRLLAPKETGQCGGIDVAVEPRFAYWAQLQTAAFPARDHHTPPLGNLLARSNEMPLTGDERHGVENRAVGVALPHQAVQTIDVTLDLKSIDRAVDYSEVDASGALTKPKLVDDQGIWLAGVLGGQNPV
jgi:hypothetical protein